MYWPKEIMNDEYWELCKVKTGGYDNQEFKL